MKPLPVLLVLVTFARVAMAQYTIAPVESCALASDAAFVNRHGVMTVSCEKPSGDPQFPLAALPSVVGRFGVRALPLPDGVVSAVVRGINAQQEVIALSVHPAPSHALLLSDRRAIDLGSLGGVWSDPRGLNDWGWVVGFFETVDNSIHAFLWRDGTMRDLGTFGATQSTAEAINNRGQIVLNRIFETNGQWQSTAAILSGGRLLEIPQLDGRNMMGLGINEDGHVVGVGFRIGDATYPTEHGFFYHDGQVEDILTGANFLWSAVLTTSINDHNQIAGTWYHYFDAEEAYGGFLYENGAPVNLQGLLPPDSGWLLQTANSINNAGQISGTGYFEGRLRAYLMTPSTRPKHK